MVVLNIKDVCHECIHFAPDIAQYPGIKVTDDVLPDGDMIIECAHRHTCQHWQDSSDTVIPVVRNGRRQDTDGPVKDCRMGGNV